MSYRKEVQSPIHPGKYIFSLPEPDATPCFRNVRMEYQNKPEVGWIIPVNIRGTAFINYEDEIIDDCVKLADNYISKYLFDNPNEK